MYWEKPGDVAPPGGESWNAAAARIAPFVDRMNQANPDTDIVAVAHIGVILTQVQRASGETAEACLAHRIDNFSVTRLTCDAGNWRVEAINQLP